MAKINTIALKIPNLGEAESTEIIEVNIKVGDKVNVNDPLIVLESEKAAMEVPSDFQGEISEILIKEGDSVHEGMEFAKIKAETEVKEAEVKEEREKEIVKEEKIINRPAIDFTGINAGPAVRKYARELEIDLSIIEGTGKNKRITKEDLKNHIHSNKSGLSLKTYKENDFVNEGSFKIQKLSKIQSLGAKNLHESWVTIPHVTHFEEADLAAINKLRKNKKSSVLAYFVHALCQILKEFPSFNSSLVDGDNLLLKEYINIGIAVDTEMGLVVPVIRNADELDAALADIGIPCREWALLGRNGREIYAEPRGWLSLAAILSAPRPFADVIASASHRPARAGCRENGAPGARLCSEWPRRYCFGTNRSLHQNVRGRCADWR